MSPKFWLNFVKQNDSMISFYILLFFFLCFNFRVNWDLKLRKFNKNWKNGGVLKLLTGSVYFSLHYGEMSGARHMINTKTFTPCLKALKGLESLGGGFSAWAFQVYQHSDTITIPFSDFNVWHIICKLTTTCSSLLKYWSLCCSLC